MTGVLTNKVVLVTGSSRGIGRAIAQAMATAGASVVVTFRENASAAQDVVDAIKAQGGHAIACQLDVCRRDSIKLALAMTEKMFAGLDIVVNNAGINKPTDFDQIRDEDWDAIMAVNLKGPYIVSQLALPLLKRRGGGSIINIGSVSGQYGGPRTAHYAASKAGLISLGQVIARFGAAHNIRCNTIAAGLIQSDMAQQSLHAPAVQQAAESIILKRLGTPDEVADVAVFLASDSSRYITAQTINVNGGLYF